MCGGVLFEREGERGREGRTVGGEMFVSVCARSNFVFVQQP